MTAVIAIIALALVVAAIAWHYPRYRRAGRELALYKQSHALIQRAFERSLLLHLLTEVQFDEEESALMAVAVSATVFGYEPTTEETRTYLKESQRIIGFEVEHLRSDEQLCELLSGAIRQMDALRWAHGQLSADNCTEGTDRLQKLGLYRDGAAQEAWTEPEAFHLRALEYAEKVDREMKRVLPSE